MSDMRPARRRPRGAVAVSALVLASVLVPASAAGADEGPAPDPVEHQVLSRLHTDAVSTFLDDGAFTLGTRADLPEGNGTRLDPAETLFHVDDASRQTVPAGYEFVAPAGTSVWIAPESNPSGGDGYTQLWPGFSTEAVPAGAVDGNTTSFRLLALDGPADGELEVWRGSGAGLTRMWSSDEGLGTFDVGRTHLHANWGFTAPGTYRLTVEGAATIAGEPVADTAVYTFVVGELPETVRTTTTLEASATQVVSGSPVTLSATVAPAGAEGWVEFRDGSAALGHVPVSDDGSAELEVTDLGLGARSVTAAFVPAVATFTTGSVSEPVTVTVLDGSGVEFAVAGVADSYAVGDTMTATAVGATLEEGQVFRWLLRTRGYDSTLVPQSTTSATYSRELDALADGSEISVTVYDAASRTTVAASAWVPVAVVGEGEAPVITPTEGFHDPLLPGDVIEYTVSGRELAEGESITWGFVPYGGWYGAQIFPGDWAATYPDEDRTTVRLTARVNPEETEPYLAPLTAAVVKDGVVIARSAFDAVSTGHRELNVSGHRTLYREGGTVALDAGLYPVRDGDRFTYTWTFTRGESTEVWGTEQQASAELVGPALTVAEHDGGTLRLDVYNDGRLAQQSAAYPVNVTDDLTSQILELGSLPGHFHQGDPVSLPLTVDPAPLAGDTLEWQWRWPGSDAWTAMPDVDDRYEVDAEQALDGVEIRVVLTYADPAVPPVVSGTRTILVDDHGAPARQQVGVTSAGTYEEGETVTLSADVVPGTVLTEYRWERKGAGDEEFAVIEGVAGATLTFEATAADDGARYRVAAVTSAGAVGYGPSDEVVLTVTEAGEEPGGEEPGGEEPGGEEPGTEPGGGEPGTDEPGTDEPGTDEPGTDEPGTDEPGTDEPGAGAGGSGGGGGDADDGADDAGEGGGAGNAGDGDGAGDAADGTASSEGGTPSDTTGSSEASAAAGGGVLAATGANGLSTLVGSAILLVLGGAGLIAVRVLPGRGPARLSRSDPAWQG